VLTNVRVSVDGVRLSRVQPSGALDVFAGQDLVLLARYDGDGDATIRIEGQSSSGRLSWSSRANFNRRTTNNSFVPRLWAAQRIGWLAAEKRRSGSSTEMDAEIKALGERYGIPTEFSSYLVVEPGMNVASRRADVGVAGMGRLRDQAALNQVVVTGAAAAPPASAPGPLAANEARFEMSRQAAGQREAKSLAVLDSMSFDAMGTRQVGTRQFAQVGKVWTDQRYVPTQRTVQVKAFSPLYFELVSQLSGLKDALSLGDEVLVSGRNVAIQVGTSGMERMNAQQVQELVKAWQ
jgi:Ca-activated chloride channel family protein